MSGCKAWASRELLVEKKDDEVGLDSRLLKKDNNRFIPLCATEGVGEGEAMRLRPRFKAQHFTAHTNHSISNFCPLQYANDIHSHCRTACTQGGTSLEERENCCKCRRIIILSCE